MDEEPPAKRNRRDEPSTSGAQQTEDDSKEEISMESGDHLKCGESEQKHKHLTIEDCYEIEGNPVRCHHRRFKTEVIEHTIHFSELSINRCVEEREHDLLGFYRDLFDRIIETLVRSFPERDRVLIEIHMPGLDRPIFVPMMEVHRINADAILDAFQKVQQSNRKIKLNGEMELRIFHIEVPNGSGGNDLEEKFLKSKKSIIRIQNRDNLCLARALVTARARLEHEAGDKTIKWESIRKGLSEQGRLAKELQGRTGACEISSNILDDVPKFQEVMKDYQILVVPMTGYEHNGFFYRGPDRPKKLYILLANNHFHVITSMKGYLECGYFCEFCYKGFKTFDHHRCTNMCECCFNNTKDGCVLDEWKKCWDCMRSFKSTSCFDRHKKVPEALVNPKKPSTAKIICDRIKLCSKCERTIKDQHKCGFAYCRSCKKSQPVNHLCYMQPISRRSRGRGEDAESDDDTGFESSSTNRKNNEQVYVFFDFECRQDDKNDGEYLHKVNYCVAQRVCDVCMDKEEVDSSCKNCNSREEIFKGDKAVDEFCDWLLSLKNVIAIAHNMKGYDGHFILKYLHRIGVCPKVIMNGSKIMSMQFPKVKLRDSLNFIPLPLSSFPKTFGIEQKKGFFPHLFNTKENEAYKGPWPDSKYYAPGQMTKEERDDFDQWYRNQVGKEFDMTAEIYTYCKNDVTLLRRGCANFRSLFLQTTGINPFLTSLTIASACMYVFRQNFLEERTIAVVPPHGYQKGNQSIEALQWLLWKEKSDKVHIQHSKNGGEKKIKTYKVDGYCESTNTIYEFNGCYWHGCPKCYPDRNTIGRGRETMADKYQRYLSRQEDLKNSKHFLEEIWECEFKQQLEESAEMKKFIKGLEIQSSLNPRDAFYGGRTNVIKLHHAIEEGERIKYIDVCSLYPWVNKYKKYPIGHPKKITENLTNDIQQYEGFIKCTILPPGDLFHPVLPYRCGDKLLFPLCAKCAEDRQKDPCGHGDDERALCGTWVTKEVKKAVKSRYTIIKVHEVWHFEETRKYDRQRNQEGLFTAYVDTFLKLKQEASGWPSECQSEEERLKFINEYKKREGIELEAENIEKNEGKRLLAKLMLNSFWGKFGQRPNLPQTEYVKKPEQFYKILRDPTKVIKSMQFVSDWMVQIQWQDTDEDMKTMSNTNIFIAAYTTALARLKLYSYLEKLDRRVLYFDTDSIIYISRENGEDEPPTGNFLGDMTDELSKAYGEGSYIREFVSGGPKNYSYEVNNPSKEKTFFECKVKGITMNYETSKQINFDVMKEKVKLAQTRITDLQPTPIRDTRILSKMGIGVVTKSCTTNYDIVVDKRRVNEDLTTLPFGFKS